MPRLMPGCKIWDVVKVPFPFTNRPVQQRRPALVVAVPEADGVPSLVWVLMVTSATSRGWSGDVPVSDLTEAGLPAPFIVRSVKLATIEAGATQLIGRLPVRDRPHVADVIRNALSDVLQKSAGPAWLDQRPRW